MLRPMNQTCKCLEPSLVLFATNCLIFRFLDVFLRPDILHGNVGFYNNYNLCYTKTINWEEILSGTNVTNYYVYDFNNSERECPPCHKTCEQGCWGEGPDNCQKFSKINCSPQCAGGRCFGKNPRDCCHLFCAGGCVGPTQTDCLVSILLFESFHDLDSPRGRYKQTFFEHEWHASDLV